MVKLDWLDDGGSNDDHSYPDSSFKNDTSVTIQGQFRFGDNFHDYDEIDDQQYIDQSPLGEVISNIFPFLSPRSIEYFLSLFDMLILLYCNWRILTTIKF